MSFSKNAQEYAVFFSWGFNVRFALQYLILVCLTSKIYFLHSFPLLLFLKPNIRMKYLYFEKKRRKNAVVEYLDYQIPVTQQKGPKGNGDMHAAKRD